MDEAFIRDLFQAVGPVRIRRMFGGAGIYAGEHMFALEADGVLYLKAGPDNLADFEREGSGPFAYDVRDGRRVMTSFWKVPEHVLDSPDDIAPWAHAALGAAERATARRKVKSRRSERAG